MSVLPQDALENIAARLRSAYSSGPIPPLRDGLAPGDANGAYAVQSHNTKYWQSTGRRIVGRKIGLTAKSVQVQLGVDQPDFGVLFDDMRVANKGVLGRSKMLQPKIEGEIALVFGSSVENPNATAEEVAAAVRAVAPAIEIVDSRIEAWKITFADTVADNGSSSFFVLGDETGFAANLDLYACGMVLELNGATASVGAGAACLGHPLIAAQWLARTLATRGEPIREGDIVLTGALGPMVPLSAGDHVRVTIGGLGRVEFSCHG
jgi:2-keto-4-pentenoate hydratase